MMTVQTYMRLGDGTTLELAVVARVESVTHLSTLATTTKAV